MKKNIIIALIVVLAIMIVCTLVFMKYVEKNQQTGKGLTPDVDVKEDNLLNLSGIGVFFDRHTGYIKSSDVGTKLTKITTEYIPDLMNVVKDYSNEELDKYYEQNKTEVEDNIGLETKEDFAAFIKALKAKEVDLTSYYKLEMLKDTYVDKSEKLNYSYVEYKVYYLDETVIRFSLQVSRKKSTTPTYVINVIN